MPGRDPLPYWRTKRLEEMSREEWEALCDGCGRCCLNKLEDESGAIEHTNVACHLLDGKTCRCGDYRNRHRLVPDCVVLTPASVGRLRWLPPTCAYRLVAEGRDLYWWHPLVSGDPDTVHQAGVSVAGRTVSENEAGPLEHHIVTWPGEVPRRARRPQAPSTKSKR